MSEVKNVPEIRFAEFTNAWEQRKLEECFKIRNEKNGDRYTREDVLAVSDTYGCVNQIEFHGRSFASEDISNYKIVRKGDIIYTKSPLQAKPYGIIKIVGNETGIISPLYVVNEAVDNIDSMYMYYLFDTPERTNNYLCPLVRKGAKNTMNISNSEWLSGEVTISPDKQEQQLIGTFFRHLDNLITLHQRKHDKLAVLKKAMLEKMFPQNGSSVPEVRFAGFTGPWEQRKLGELALFNPKDELPKTFEYVDLESVVGTEMLSHRTEAKVSAPSRAQRLARTGDLFYQTVRPYQKNNYLFEKPDNNYVFSTGYAQMRPFVDGYFLLSLVQNESFVKVVLDSCTGTSYPAINANDLAEIEVFAPSDKNEAHKIGTIFRSLDNLITLQQRKYETLKRVKAALLQKMFV